MELMAPILDEIASEHGEKVLAAARLLPHGRSKDMPRGGPQLL